MESVEIEISFHTKTKICYRTTNICNVISESRDKIMESFDSFETKGIFSYLSTRKKVVLQFEFTVNHRFIIHLGEKEIDVAHWIA